jgi:hypothetical protein
MKRMIGVEDEPRRSKKLLAALSVSILLYSGVAAYAGPQELIDYTRRLLDTNEIPELADDADLTLIHDGKSAHISAAELREENIQSNKLIKNIEIKEFKVQTATCSDSICNIKYSYHATAHLKNDTEVSAAVTCDEDYRLNGTKFILIRGRQVEASDTAS